MEGYFRTNWVFPAVIDVHLNVNVKDYEVSVE